MKRKGNMYDNLNEITQCFANQLENIYNVTDCKTLKKEFTSS